MEHKRNKAVDQDVLLVALESLESRGISPVRSSDLTRESEVLGHRVPKKFVRRRLTVNGDGRTGMDRVRVVRSQRGQFWFYWNGTVKTDRCPTCQGIVSAGAAVASAV